MISDPKKIPLDIVTKQFFSCRMNFFLQQELFFSLQEKNLVPRKTSGGKKKNGFVTLSRGIFLESEKIPVILVWFLLIMNLTISMKRSRQDLSVDMAVRRGTF